MGEMRKGVGFSNVRLGFVNEVGVMGMQDLGVWEQGIWGQGLMQKLGFNGMKLNE